MSWTSTWSAKVSKGLISCVTHFFQCHFHGIGSYECHSSSEVTLKNMVIFTVTNQKTLHCVRGIIMDGMKFLDWLIWIKSHYTWHHWPFVQNMDKYIQSCSGCCAADMKKLKYFSWFCCKINVKWNWNINHGHMIGCDIPFMLVIICAKYGKYPSRNGDCTEQT